MTPVETFAAIVLGILATVIAENDAEWPQPPEAAVTECVTGSVYMNGWATICPEREGVDNSGEAPAEQEQEQETY